MNIVCLDFEGVLVPDIWPHVAASTNVPDLKLTTRDVKDYRELMERRVRICREHNITLSDIQTYISQLEPLPDAEDFVQWIRERYQFILLSDTFYEFVPHFMKIFNYPTLFCHSISYNSTAESIEFFLRMDNQKAAAVRSLREQNFKVFAAGDSYNDVTMLKEANGASFFQAPDGVLTDFPEFPNLKTYEEMKSRIEEFFRQD